MHFTAKMSVVRLFSVRSKDELALSKTGRFLSKAEILGLVDVSDIFFFFCSREGEGDTGQQGGGGRFFTSAPGKWGRPRSGQTVFNQILTRFHGIRLKSG